VDLLWLLNDFSKALDFSKFMEKSMTQLETISRCDTEPKAQAQALIHYGLVCKYTIRKVISKP